jgi:hypothetical protein
MADTHIPIRLVNTAGGVEDGAFFLDEDADDDLCRLTFRFPHGEHNAVADDYFEAMCIIRGELKRVGWFPLCYGGSLNVFPSGMSRGMGCRGQLAYKLQLGKPARQADLVSIFDHGSDVNPVSVDEQSLFYKQWLQSVTHRPQ